jgi:hypothetical protein
MRIAFTGPSGTGKTTLARAVSERYGIPLCPVGSRSVAEAMGLSNPYDVDRLGLRSEFQRRLLGEKASWEARHERFVTDRTQLDNLAYAALHCAKDVDASFYEACFMATTRYKAIVHCSLHGFQHLGGDPARVTNPIYHRLFESLLVTFLDAFAERGDFGCGYGGAAIRSLVSKDEARRKTVVFDLTDRFFDVADRRPVGLLGP